MFISALLPFIYVQHIRDCWPRKSEDGIQFSRTGVTDRAIEDCELSCGYWKESMGTPEENPVFLTNCFICLALAFSLFFKYIPVFIFQRHFLLVSSSGHIVWIHNT